MKALRNHIMTGPQTISFELSQSALQARRNAKWNQYEADVIPAFVADMDFAVAAPIQAAIERIVRDRDYGYPLRDGEKADRLVADAFSMRMKSRFGWELSPDLVVPVADLVQGTYAPILAFSDPGDGVVLQVPNYPPFRDAIATTERISKGTVYQHTHFLRPAIDDDFYVRAEVLRFGKASAFTETRVSFVSTGKLVAHASLEFAF